MEKILNFNSRYKVQLTPNRHSTLPPSYYTSSESKDLEKEAESPVFTRKKEDHSKGRQPESNLLSLTKVKTFNTDCSEPNTPESKKMFFIMKLYFLRASTILLIKLSKF